MTEAEYAKKLEELDRQLNDPDVPMDPARVWELLADMGDRASRSIGHGHQLARRGPIPTLGRSVETR